MAHIFRHKENNQLYTIEHLKVDLRFLNGGAFTGIYAYPYRWEGEKITHLKGCCKGNFNPEKFVEDNFEIVGELW